jgi:hypothetical protein
VAKRKKGGNVFRCMKLEESMTGEDSKLAGTCYKLAGTHITIGKLNSDENFGVQKVRNWNNCGIPRNFEQISQPKFHVGSRQLWHQIQWQITCLPSHTSPQTKLPDSRRLGRDTIHRTYL